MKLEAKKRLAADFAGGLNPVSDLEIPQGGVYHPTGDDMRMLTCVCASCQGLDSQPDMEVPVSGDLLMDDAFEADQEGDFASTLGASTQLKAAGELVHHKVKLLISDGRVLDFDSGADLYSWVSRGGDDEFRPFMTTEVGKFMVIQDAARKTAVAEAYPMETYLKGTPPGTRAFDTKAADIRTRTSMAMAALRRSRHPDLKKVEDAVEEMYAYLDSHSPQLKVPLDFDPRSLFKKLQSKLQAKARLEASEGPSHDRLASDREKAALKADSGKKSMYKAAAQAHRKAAAAFQARDASPQGKKEYENAAALAYKADRRLGITAAKLAARRTQGWFHQLSAEEQDDYCTKFPNTRFRRKVGLTAP